MEQRCRVSRALTSLMSRFTKGWVALFAGNKNNLCVYTINGREQSIFSGEIWTLQRYHLLLPLNQAVHFTRSYKTSFSLCPLFFMSFVEAYCVSYIMSNMFCYTGTCYLMYCMCLYFDTEYLELKYNMHLLQNGNFFAENIRFIPWSWCHFSFFPLYLYTSSRTQRLLLFSLWQDDKVDARVDSLEQSTDLPTRTMCRSTEY